MTIVDINKEEDTITFMNGNTIFVKSLSIKSEELNVSIDTYIDIMYQRSNYDNNAKGYERAAIL